MFRNVLHNRIAVLSLSGILAVGAIAGAGVAVASAMGGGTSASPTATASSNTSDAPAATPTMTTTQQCHAKFRLAEGLIKDVAAKSGMDAKTIAADLKSGKTLNDILGSNASTVEQQVLADVQARIQQAEQDGQLTSAQATKLSQKAPDALSKFFSSVHTPGSHASKIAAAGATYGVTRASLLQTAATTIGIDPATLKSDIKSGQTIAQVAGDKTSAVITALQQQVDAAIQKAASDGKLTSDQASALTTKANQRITNIVNNGFHKKASGSNSGACS